MLTLMLLRHAKAEPHGATEDVERRLTAKGEDDAGRLGAFCRDEGLLPELSLVSAARRTRMTYQRFAANTGLARSMIVEDALYNASARAIRERIGAVREPASTLMVVGHNPGIMEAAIELALDGDFGERERLANRFPPCALAVVRFDVTDWNEAIASRGRLDQLIFPEDL